MAVPQPDEQDAKDHAAEVGEMGHAVGSAHHSIEQLDGTEDQYEPLGFDGEEEVDVNQRVGE